MQSIKNQSVILLLQLLALLFGIFSSISLSNGTTETRSPKALNPESNFSFSVLYYEESDPCHKVQVACHHQTTYPIRYHQNPPSHLYIDKMLELKVLR